MPLLSERELVIRSLHAALEDAGINPDGPFTATYIPGEGWTYETEGQAAADKSSVQGGPRASSSFIPSQRK